MATAIVLASAMRFWSPSRQPGRVVNATTSSGTMSIAIGLVSVSPQVAQVFYPRVSSREAATVSRAAIATVSLCLSGGKAAAHPMSFSLEC